MAVSYEEVKAPVLEVNVNNGTLQGTRVFKIAWSDLDAFCAEILQMPSVAGDQVLQPPRYAWPGRGNLILSGIRAEPIDPDCILANDANGIATGNGYFVTLTYASRQFDSQQDNGQGGNKDENTPKPFMTHRVNGTVRMLTVPHWAVKWEAPGKGGHDKVADDVLPATPEVCIEHVITWHDVPMVPSTRIHARLGTLNSKRFLKHDPTTLLFQSYDAVRQYSLDPNEKKWEITLHFLARINQGKGYTSTGIANKTVGWLHFYRPDPRTSPADTPWQKILNQDGTDLISQTDFSEIFVLNPEDEEEDSTEEL